MINSSEKNSLAMASRPAPPPRAVAGEREVLSDVRLAKFPIVGLYAGSFDPPHLGHIDIAQRSFSFVDRLEISVAADNDKNSTFSINERIELLSRCFNNDSRITVSSYKGLTTNHAISVGASILIRGLRSTNDMFVEHQTARANASLVPHLDTVFLMAKEQHMLTSSTLIRQISALGGDVSGYVPPCVVSELSKLFPS